MKDSWGNCSTRSACHQPQQRPDTAPQQAQPKTTVEEPDRPGASLPSRLHQLSTLRRYSITVGSGGGWDRPKAACPPGGRDTAGGAGGFNAVQNLLATTSAAKVSCVEPVNGIEPALSAWEASGWRAS
jgi:hypothetical protein